MTTHDCPLTAECLDAHAQQARDAVWDAAAKLVMPFVEGRTTPDAAVEGVANARVTLAELEAFAYARGAYTVLHSGRACNDDGCPFQDNLRTAIAAIVRRAG